MLPKTHSADLFDLPDEYCEKIMPAAKKCCRVLKKVLQCDGVNVLQNNGEAAGQTVFHTHIHLIPRYKEDTVRIGWSGYEEKEEFEALAARLRAGFEE